MTMLNQMCPLPYCTEDLWFVARDEFVLEIGDTPLTVGAPLNRGWEITCTAGHKLLEAGWDGNEPVAFGQLPEDMKMFRQMLDLAKNDWSKAPF